MRLFPTVVWIAGMAWCAAPIPGQTPAGDDLPLEEILASLAANRLEDLCSLLASPKVEEPLSTVLEAIALPTARATHFIPETPDIRSLAGSIEVRRAIHPEKQALVPLAEAIAHFHLRSRDAVETRRAVKVFSITPGPQSGACRTRQFVSSLIRRPGELSELEAEWSADWSFDPERPGQSFRLQSLTVDHQEETVRKDASQPFLADCTRAVLAGSGRFEELILRDNVFWRHQIEAALYPDPFGWNGLAVADVDGDGLEDLYLCHFGGLPNQLFLRQPGGSFRDAAAEAGLDLLDNSQAALFADFDNDGDQDCAVSTTAGLALFRQESPLRFTLIERFEHIDRAYSLAVADPDGDGDLDLYVCQYYPGDAEPGALAAPWPIFDARGGGRNVFLRNDGALRFTDATADSGFEEENQRFSYAAVWEDFDNDGDPDLFVANDFGRNQLYRNDSGRFRDVSSETGLEQGAFGMSACTGDFDLDGFMDIYVSNMFSSAGSRVTGQDWFKPGGDPGLRARFQHLTQGNTLLRNRGGLRFEDVSFSQRVHMGRWSWGSLFADLNNDGWEDLLVANGMITGRQPDDL
ncbi:MAG TPA: VCBS repeat-containing protein [Verrucomicrobiales bacterium]|nr:VCBS repeat-containing protein [Verrucomicrobiales bacterium]